MQLGTGEFQRFASGVSLRVLLCENGIHVDSCLCTNWRIVLALASQIIF